MSSAVKYTCLLVGTTVIPSSLMFSSEITIMNVTLTNYGNKILSEIKIFILLLFF